MKAKVQQRLEEIKGSGYSLNFNETFNQTIDIFKEIIWLGGLALFIANIAMTTINQVLSLIFQGGMMFSIDFDNPDSYSNSIEFLTSPIFWISMVAYLVATMAIGFFYNLIVYGILEMAKVWDQERNLSFEAVFAYFKMPYIKRLAGAYLIYMLLGVFIMAALFTPFVYFLIEWQKDVIGLDTHFKENIGFILFFSILAILVIIFLMIFFVIQVPFIVFGDASPIESFKASFQVVKKNYITILLLYISCAIISVLGILACCIGLFFTLVLIYTLPYVLYKNTIGFDDESEIEQIGNSTH